MIPREMLVGRSRVQRHPLGRALIGSFISRIPSNWSGTTGLAVAVWVQRMSASETMCTIDGMIMMCLPRPDIRVSYDTGDDRSGNVVRMTPEEMADLVH